MTSTLWMAWHGLAVLGGDSRLMPSVKKPKRQLQPHFLKQWREHRHLTQEQAAPRLNMSRSQLSKIENLETPYSQGLMEAAAEAYDCTVADLTMRNPLDKTAPWSLMDSLRKATPAQREIIADVIDQILKKRA